MRKTAAISGKSPPPRRILVLAFPQAKLLDVTGPCEVFADANRVLGRGGYQVDLVAAEPGPFETSSGVHLVAHHGYASAPGPVDTLLVSGGPGVDRAAGDPALLRWIERAPGRVRRVGSVCTGAFLLAAAGVLDARRATTHWAFCDRLAREYPRVAVDPDPIFVRDGNVYTSAGRRPWPSLGTWSSSSAGRAVSRSSALRSNSRPRTGSRCPSSRRGWPGAWPRTCPSRPCPGGST